MHMKTCSVEDCGKPAPSRGWCRAHYARWKRHGDPLGGATAIGEAARYFRDVVMNYEGDECLAWPYAKNVRGYGLIQLAGNLRYVSRVVCERVHGPPPTPKHQAAHSCGNGHEACCTKRHLLWKTPKANSADQLRHGTRYRGERHHKAKLTEPEVRQICELKGTMSQRAIGELFGISDVNVSVIHRGRSWGHVP